jgi:hypothetical protein
MKAIRLMRKTPFPALAAADAVISVIHLAETLKSARLAVRIAQKEAGRSLAESGKMQDYLLTFGDSMTDENLNRRLGEFLEKFPE